MDKEGRRKFIKSLSTGIASSVFIPAHAIINNNTIVKTPIPNSGKIHGNTSEPFWEEVKKHFAFADKLHYFNNL